MPQKQSPKRTIQYRHAQQYTPQTQAQQQKTTTTPPPPPQPTPTPTHSPPTHSQRVSQALCKRQSTQPMRVYPWVDPQPRNTMRAARMNASSENKKSDNFDHWRREDLHHIHDLFHNQRAGWRDTKTLFSLSARVTREQSTKLRERLTHTLKHSNTQARATLGSRPSNRATQAPDLGKATVHHKQLITATQPCGSVS